MRSKSTLLGLEEQEQHSFFVGRNSELALWRSALTGSGVHVFFVHGPAGIGKTSLLHAFNLEARRRSVAVVRLDARDLEPTLPNVTAALDDAGVSGAEDDFGGLPNAVLIDTYERLGPIEPLVRHELMRRVRTTTLLVIAGRRPPSAEWRALSLWGKTILPIALRNLGSTDAREYLARRGIRGKTASELFTFSHGHPLALAISADAWHHAPERAFSPSEVPDIITTLYDYFVQGVSDSQRTALEIAAVLHTTSETMLAALLEHNATENFDWLRSLSFMKLGSRGVFPHDLAREVILAELRWRSPERLAAWVARGQRYCTTVLMSSSGAQFAQASTDYNFMAGHSPRLRMMLVHPDHSFVMDSLRPTDEPVLCAAVQRHEGPTSTQHMRHWLKHQPSAFRIVRDPTGTPVAFVCLLRLDLIDAEELEGDPLACEVWNYALGLIDGAPVGPMVLHRFFMACDTYQELSPGMAFCFTTSATIYFIPGFTLSFLRVHENQKWEELMRLAGSFYVAELEHEVDGKRYQITLQDNRGISGAEYFATISERLTTEHFGQSTPQPSDTSSLAALSQDEYGRHVRKALRVLHDDYKLANNPLVHSQAVRARVPSTAPWRELATMLRAIIIEAAESLEAGYEDLYRVLDAAYLNPVGKHVAAADALNVTYASFRRRLATGIELLIATLWERELVY